MANQSVDPSSSGSERFDSPIPEVGPAPSPGTAFAELSQRLGEAWAFAAYYLRTRIDQLRLSVQRIVLLAALGVLALAVGAAMLVTAAVLILIGISHLIGQLTGYYWLGDLATGIFVVAAVMATAYWATNRITRMSRISTREKYERRLREQREQHGTDVNERAHRN